MSSMGGGAPIGDLRPTARYASKDRLFVSVANNVAMNVTEANRINIIDTPAVPPM